MGRRFDPQDPHSQTFVNRSFQRSQTVRLPSDLGKRHLEKRDRS